jgi:hypothetical protein
LNYSILFMLAMVLGILGSFAFLIWNAYRKASLGQ